MNNLSSIDGLERTPSVAYREGSKEAIERVLAEVEKESEKRIRYGFSELNFTLGVLNCFFLIFMFCVYPQNLWIVYIAQALFLFPAKFRIMIKAKPLNQAFYYFDLCWFMNFVGVGAFILLFTEKGGLSDEFRKQLFYGAYGIACGPLLGATIVLPFVSLVFHHLESMTDVFIHFFPPMLFYILRWEAQEVRDAWPDAFGLDYNVVFWPTNGTFTNCVFGNSILFYLAWFVPYTIWQILIGLDLPRTNRQTKLSDGSPAPTVYDTVFHSTMRNGLCVVMGKYLWNRPEEASLGQVRTNDFEMRDFYAYMIAHAIATLASFIFSAYPCYLSKAVHGGFLCLLTCICTYRGAMRYTYYSTKMYSKLIRTRFTEEINELAEIIVTNSKSNENIEVVSETTPLV